MNLKKALFLLTSILIISLSGCSDVGNVNKDSSSENGGIDTNSSDGIGEKNETIPNSDINLTDENKTEVIEEKVYVNPFQPNTTVDPNAPLYEKIEEEKIYLNGKEVKTLSNEISFSINLTSDFVWEISDEVKVLEGVVLTIENGTELFGKNETSSLTFQEGSTLIAIGKKSSPIIFSSKRAVDGNFSNSGEWGGITISNSYNSILKYVEINFAGHNRSALKIENESSNTILEFVKIYSSKSDGFQFVGGEINLRNSIVVGAFGDSLSLQNGWNGNVQNLYISQTSDLYGDKSSGVDIGKGSFGNFSNLLIESSAVGVGAGIYIRDGGDLTLLNSIILGERKGVCVESETLLTESIILSNSFGNCGGGDMKLISFDKDLNFVSKSASSVEELSRGIEPTDPLTINSWFDEYPILYLGTLYK
jgi:hypothetical protein